MDMRIDILAEQSYGKLALLKLEPVDPNFRLYEAGWLGNGMIRDVMEVKGAVFREAMSGENKGQLCMLVKGTVRIVYVTSEEIKAYKG